MNKYEDEGLVRNRRIQVLLTEDEHERLSIYRQTSRAPSLSYAARELLLSGLKTYSKHTQNIVGFEESNNERKESSKEKIEIKKKTLKEEEARARKVLDDGFLPTADVDKGEYLEQILTDNTEHLNALLLLCRLPPQDDIKAWFKPFIERFRIDLLSSGEDLYLLDRLSLKARFKYWFKKHYNDESNDIARDQNGSMGTGHTVQEAGYTVDWENF